MPAGETTLRDLLVIPSAGEGVSTPIPADLTTYCNLLQAAAPTQFVRTENYDQDCLQIHSIALLKSSAVDSDLFGITVVWVPRFFHAVDPDDPEVWDSGPTPGVIYGLRMSDGTSWWLCVCEGTITVSIS